MKKENMPWRNLKAKIIEEESSVMNSLMKEAHKWFLALGLLVFLQAIHIIMAVWFAERMEMDVFQCWVVITILATQLAIFKQARQ